MGQRSEVEAHPVISKSHLHDELSRFDNFVKIDSRANSQPIEHVHHILRSHVA